MAGSLAAPKMNLKLMVGDDEGKNFHYKFKRIPIYLIVYSSYITKKHHSLPSLPLSREKTNASPLSWRFPLS